MSPIHASLHGRKSWPRISNTAGNSFNFSEMYIVAINSSQNLILMHHRLLKTGNNLRWNDVVLKFEVEFTLVAMSFINDDLSINPVLRTKYFKWVGRS